MTEAPFDPELDRQAKLDLLVLHVPKTGGTALRGALARRYGEALALRYRQDRWDQLAGKQALIGHFPAAQVAHIQAARRVTVLRDPLDRAISEYFHFKTGASPGNPHADRVRAGQGFVDFLAQPAFCKAYTGYYFAGADMALWQVIDHGRLRQDWRAIMADLDLPTRPREANVRAEVFPGYLDARAALIADAAVMDQARALLADDLAFHRRWAR